MAAIEKRLNIIVGQGLAGSAVAWQLFWRGERLLLVDSGQPNSASRVAAGLITPITGKRLVKSPEFEKEFKTAREFYQRTEHETGSVFFHEQPMLRLFSNEESRAEFLQRSDHSSDVVVRQCSLQRDGSIHPAVELFPAARLDVNTYLTATQRFFESRGCFQKA